MTADKDQPKPSRAARKGLAHFLKSEDHLLKRMLILFVLAIIAYHGTKAVTAPSPPPPPPEPPRGWVAGDAIVGMGRGMKGTEETGFLWALKGHTEGPEAMAFHPGGKILVTGSDGERARLWDVATGELTRIHTDPDTKASVMAFSPDGKVLALAKYYLRLLDPETGDELRSTEIPGKGARCLVFSPDGTSIAAASYRERGAILFDFQSLELVRTFDAHKDEVVSVAISPDGKTLASGGSSQDLTIKFWEVSSGWEQATLEGHRGYITGLAFTPDGKTLASADVDDTIRLWDVARRKEKGVLEGHGDAVWTIAISPDGKTLASGSSDTTVKLWGLESREVEATIEGHVARVLGVAFSPDGKVIASASSDRTIKLWDAARARKAKRKVWRAGAEDGKKLEGHTDDILSLAFSPDSKSLASGSKDQTIKIWSVSRGRERRTLEGHSEGVSVLACSPDGKILVSGSLDDMVKTWELESGKELLTMKGQPASVKALTFGAGSKIFAAGHRNLTIKHWEVGGDRAIRDLGKQKRGVKSVVFGPGGRLVASAGMHYVKVWDPEGNGEMRSFEHNNPSPLLAFSPDALTLATSREAFISLRDVATGRTTTSMECSRSVAAMAFGPGGKVLAAADYGPSVYLWDVTCGQKIGEISGLTSLVGAVSISPDGKKLAVATGEEILLFDR